MKRFFGISAVVITVCAVSFYAFAQPGGPRAPGGPDGGALLSPTGNVRVDAIARNAELVQALGITPAQMDTLRKIEEEFRPTPPQPGGPPAPPPSGQPGTRPAPPNPAEAMERADAMWIAVNQALTQEQGTKFREIAFQLSGGLNAPRLHERLLDTLDLTTSQRETIRKMAIEQEMENRAARGSGADRELTPEQRRAADEERNAKYANQVKAVLTSGQIAKAEKLTAEIPALRERLGMPTQFAQGQRPERTQRGQGAGQRQGGGYAPDTNSWRPGQGAPPATPGAAPQGRFPRGDALAPRTR